MKHSASCKIILIVVVALLASGCSLSASVRHLQGGVLTGNITWSGRVHIRGDVELAENARLTIRPGTEVVFHPAGDADSLTEHPNFIGSELIVRGRLIAEGTAEKPISFRHIDPAAPPGSWGGINIVESPDASFAYVSFRQADSAVHSQDSRVYIEQSLFEDNLVAIRFHSSQILIENNLIRNNGSGIRFHFGQPVICKNELIGNGKGIFVTSHPNNYLIENNTIMANTRNVVLGEEVPEDVVMLRNYWGTDAVAEIRRSFFDGQIESYLGTVRILPLRQQPDPESGISWSK